jgi:SAM-dependent methyltransferase
MRISQKHSNRRAYNWIIYDIGDRYLLKYTCYFKGTLYDLGSGESPFKDFLLKYVRQYIAVDWAGSFHKTKADIAADLNKPLPIESEVADTVVSISVMEHLCEPQMMLNEALRILKPGACIVLQVPWQWHIHEAPHDYFRYTPFALRYLLEKAGFVDIVIEPCSGFFTTVVLKLNYFSCRFIRGPRPLRWIIKGLLLPIWFVGQMVAPWLDKLDRNWVAEAAGYYVIARKPVRRG